MVHVSRRHALSRNGASELRKQSQPSLIDIEVIERTSTQEKTPLCTVPHHTTSFVDTRAADWMDSTRGRNSSSSVRGATTCVHRQGMLSLLRALPPVEGLLPPMKLAVHCCHGQYLCSIPTPLPTTITAVVEQGVIPTKTWVYRNKIEREATSDEQPAALSTSSLGPQSCFSQESWPGFR
ncbi:hypothetical protein MTO96_021755 [Rhipicephalus appendiculatus]